MCAQDGKLFVFNVKTRDLDEFRRYADLASRLRKHGRVVIDVSTLAEPTPYGLPPRGSWHDYLTWHAGLIKFFPHPKLVPHLPKGYAAKNRKLLAAKVEVLKGMDLEAAFYAFEPAFWPKGFFEEHPHLRGPRVDHPRRSIREEFAACTDLPEVRRMYEWMMAELKIHVPMLASFTFRANDAGSGFCWASALYTGMHGPAHCEKVDPGVRVQKFMETLHRGAEAGGGRIRIHCNGNFYNNEVYTIVPKLPPDSFLRGWKTDAVDVHGLSRTPVRGIMNPLSVITAMDRFAEADTREFGFNLWSRSPSSETEETLERVIDVVESCIDDPAGKGLRGRMNKLFEFCETWAGEENADALFDAFLAFDQAVALKSAAYARSLTLTCGATMRLITRPLLIRPELLTVEEEAYFLPYVFNIRESEARTDYADLHGRRIEINPLVRTAANDLVAAAGRLEAVAEGAPGGPWLKRLAAAVRIWASVLRSVCNFCEGQKIRDRNALALTGPEHVPEKTGDFYGHEDYIPWNGVMRDEFDNASELLALIEGEGRDLVITVKDPAEESPFALGPDLTGALRAKMRLMRDHWRDVEKYLAPPAK